MEILTVEVEDRCDPVVVRPRGEADISTVYELTTALRGVARAHPATVVLELSELAFLDCSGIDAILKATRRFAETGSTLVLRSPTRGVARVLDLLDIGYQRS